MRLRWRTLPHLPDPACLLPQQQSPDGHWHGISSPEPAWRALFSLMAQSGQSTRGKSNICKTGHQATTLASVSWAPAG